MKFRITFKDCDGVWQAIEDAATKYAESVEGITYHERECVKEDTETLLKDKIRRWVEHEEDITVEFDTEEGTANVVAIA